jgi:hypothetical protein
LYYFFSPEAATASRQLDAQLRKTRTEQRRLLKEEPPQRPPCPPEKEGGPRPFTMLPNRVIFTAEGKTTTTTTTSSVDHVPQSERDRDGLWK